MQISANAKLPFTIEHIHCTHTEQAPHSLGHTPGYPSKHTHIHKWHTAHFLSVLNTLNTYLNAESLIRHHSYPNIYPNTRNTYEHTHTAWKRGCASSPLKRESIAVFQKNISRHWFILINSANEKHQSWCWSKIQVDYIKNQLNPLISFEDMVSICANIQLIWWILWKICR